MGIFRDISGKQRVGSQKSQFPSLMLAQQNATLRTSDSLRGNLLKMCGTITGTQRMPELGKPDSAPAKANQALAFVIAPPTRQSG
jgi:hypothetical protein